MDSDFPLMSFEEARQFLNSFPSRPDEATLKKAANILYRLPLRYSEREDSKCARDPEGHFYLNLHVFDGTGAETQGWVNVESCMAWLIQSRMGLSFYKENGESLRTMSHGDVLSWKLYGTPTSRALVPEGQQFLKEAEEYQLGVPNEQALPSLVRDALRWAVRERLGIQNPRVGLVARASQPGVFMVTFDLDPQILGGEEGAVKAFKYLVWYMPGCIPNIYLPGMAGASWMGPL